MKDLSHCIQSNKILCIENIHASAGPAKHRTTNKTSAPRAGAEAGEPVAVVRVRDLQGQGAVPVGRDAWGRPGRPQPVLLSAEVSFARPFGAASEGDRLGAETVHYGTLSKSLLAGLELCRQGEEAKVKAGVEEGREGGGGGGEPPPLPPMETPVAAAACSMSWWAVSRCLA